MTKKEPVCNVTVNERKAEYISEVEGQSLFVLSTMQKSV